VARAIALSSRSWREWHEVPASSKDAFRCNAKHAIAAYRSWHKTWQVRLGTNGKDEELARSIQRYFFLDAKQQIVWGPDYNQAARDVYERACRYLGQEPIAIEP